MRSRLLWLLLALAAPAIALEAGAPPLELKPSQQEARAAHLASVVLEQNHYRNLALDDALSERMFDLYLKHLDPEKLFFTQADIGTWSHARTRLDDAIAKGNLELPFALFNLYAQRVVERYAYARSLLSQDFDFRQDESFQYSRSKAPWARSDDEIRDLWRRRVKNDWLQLKLSGKDPAAIRATLDRRYDYQSKRVRRLKSEEAFQTFMNAYTMAEDPHTNYLGRKASENFDISMKLSLVGIGAVLEEKDGYTTIRELMAGGPAALSGQIGVGDRVVGIAQGDKAPMTDVVGWGLEETVSLIRGTPDSTVLLDILPASAGPDEKPQRISLIRKKVSLDSQAAKKSVVAIREGGMVRRIGVIALPTFYEDFGARQRGDTDFKGAARDVERLIGELKKERVTGIVIDLRNNGGGSLREAIELTGLFIDKGPVVQERDAQGRITVEEDTRAGAAWDGPLAVLINRSSASASEIFAAAIQDYGRGVIIGERSYGKGTVQSMFSLDEMARNAKPELGDLKLTVAQFFRIDGGTTQLRGVTPDIAFPAFSDEENVGEAALDNPLPWMQIQAAAYRKSGDPAPLLPILLARHAARMEKDAGLRQLRDDIDEIKERRKDRTLSLNEAKRRAERERAQSRLLALLKLQRDEIAAADAASGSRDASRGNPPEEKELQASLDAFLDGESLERTLKGDRDLLLIEAAHILSDEIGLLEDHSRIATTGKPGPSLPGLQ